MDDDDNDFTSKEVCNVEDDEEVKESAQAKSIESTSSLSRQELPEQNLTHVSFRKWCPPCVKGKAEASNRSITGGADESSVPIIGFAHASLSNRENAQAGDYLQTTQDVYESVVKALVGHDRTCKTCAAIPVTHKGLDPEELFRP